MTPRMFNVSLLTAVLLCLSLSSNALAQQTASTPDSTSSDGKLGGGKPGAGYRIGPGDVLVIEVAGEPDLKRKVKVLEQGTIQLPYIDHDLKVGGLTEHQVNELLRREFTSILKEPQVTVFIEEYRARMASIAGAVNQPKQIPLTREIRLYDLVSLAGGLTDKAGNIVQLIHTKPTDSIEVINLNDIFRKPELNRILQDGDFINVPEAGVFYVSGNVSRPGAFPMKEATRISQAIALAGGVLQDSKKKEVLLVRSEGPDQANTTKQIVNLYEVEKDPSKDIILKPYDVVLVPESTRAKQTRTLIQTFAGGLASALGWGILR
ncbi:MAG: polysaccharide biosynthesis/export family protein [Blastocatellales bacterium]